MKSEYDIAEEIFKSGDYISAFDAFRALTERDIALNEDVSDAFNMMGVSILMDTNIDNWGDESGLVFFKKALEYNPLNTGALFNVIECFGLAVNSHRDIVMLDAAVKKLTEMQYNFSNEEKLMIHSKNMLKSQL